MSMKKLLKVTFPNGSVICLNSRTDTMIAVLNEIGERNFTKINIKWRRLPLVSQIQYLKYEEWMKPICPGWFLNTKSTAAEKFQQLERINTILHLGLKVEFDVGFDAQDKNSNTFSQGKLLVKMPDGEYIGNESGIDTFIETIWKLGIDTIMRKEVKWNGCQLITTSKTDNNQIQINENRWIVVPRLNKDKVKLLRVIGAILHLKINVTLI